MKGNTWIRTLTYALVIFVGPLLAYYLFYVQAREEVLIDRAYTHLTNISMSAEARINNVFTVIQNACKELDKFEDVFEKNQLGLTLISLDEHNCPTDNKTDFQTNPEDNQNKQQNNNTENVPSIQPGNIDIAQSDGDKIKPDNQQNIDENIEQINQPNSFSTTKDVLLTGSESLKITYGGVVASGNIKKLIGAIDLGDRFQDILIFDDNDNTIYQEHPKKGRIENRKELLSLVNEQDKKKQLINDPLNNLRVNYRGRHFLMPIQPLKIELNVPNQGNWFVAGLIEEKQFNSQKLTFQPDTVALAVLAIATIILIGPFLKIWYMGRFESLKKIDVIFLIGSGFTLCSLLTLVVMQFYVRGSTNHYMEEQSKTINKNIVDDVYEEIDIVIKSLSKLEGKMLEVFDELKNNPNDCSGNAIQESQNNCGPKQAENPDNCETEPANKDSCTDPLWAGDLLVKESFNHVENIYPFFKMTYLVNEDGCQLIKWSTRPKPTNIGCFKDRAYFLRAKPDEKLPLQLYSLNKIENRKNELDRESLTNEQFFIEFVTSRTTGEKTIMFSKTVDRAKFNDGEGTKAEESCLVGDKYPKLPCVTVLTTSSLSALQPVLPHGFGFALIDGNGNLLTHSEGNANTELNLIDEIVDGSLLQAALYSKSNADFHSEYRNAQHHFFVNPLDIEGADFYLVTFFSLENVLMPMLEAAGMTFFTWLIWFAILFFIALTLWQWNKFLEGRLFSKVGITIEKYELVLLLGIVPVFGACLFRSQALIIAPLYIVPVLAASLLKAFKNPKSRPLKIVAISWLLVLSATTLPVIGLFNMLHGVTSSSFLQLHEFDYKQSSQKQRLIIRDWLSTRNLDKNDFNFRQMEDNSENIYKKYWKKYCLSNIVDLECAFNKKPNPGEPNSFSLIARYMLGKLPDYSDVTMRLHAMYRLQDEDLTTASLPRISFLSVLPSLNSLSALVLSLVLPAILGVSLWYVLVRILGLRAEDYIRLFNFNFPRQQGGARQIIYGLGEDTKVHFFNSEEKERICKLNLRIISHDEAVNNIEQLTRPGSNIQDIVILDHFDDCLVDRDVVLAHIELLELINKHPRVSVVILLTIDPLAFVTATFNSNEDNALIARMAGALSQYKVSYYQEEAPEYLGDSREEKALREECYHPNLRSIYHSIHEQSSHKNLDNNEIIQLVKSRANAIYQQMWNLCTRAEKIMLVELAHENMVNPNNWDLARRLKQRGYLRRDPFHRIFNESFKQFILRTERVEKIEEWRSESASTWHNIRLPLFVIVIGAIVFLGVTQPSFFNSVFAFAAAGSASLPFLVNLILAKLKQGTDK